MTREEIEELKGLAASMGLYDDKKPCKRAVILGKAIEALEQEPCKDADTISRQAAIRWVKTECNPYGKPTLDFESGKKVIEHLKRMSPVTPQPKTGHCKDCKWWKDSDGAYRRGIGAESKCPMNRIEVYEGNGYCFMFESQERSDKE